MRLLILAASCLSGLLILARPAAHGQTRNEPSLEIASVKLAAPSATAIVCTGGPGTADPGMWRCSNVSVSFLISKAYGFAPFEFDPADRCCQTRVDLLAKIPPNTTRQQFQKMQQNLLIERLKLRLHLQPKEMPVYELAVSERGLKMKESPRGALPVEPDPWGPPKFRAGKDGYPELLPGQAGVARIYDNYRWIGINLSCQDIAKILSAYAGRLVLDKTGLRGRYSFDVKWSVDAASVVASLRRQSGDAAPEKETSVADEASGPTLRGAIQERLGLKLNAKKGWGEVVIIDHIETTPAPN